MLNVTDAALEALVMTLDANEIPQDKGLRLGRSPYGDLGLEVDEPRDGDQVLMQGDRAVLFLDSEVSEILSGATLDVIQEPDGARLTLRMPGDAAE